MNDTKVLEHIISICLVDHLGDVCRVVEDMLKDIKRDDLIEQWNDSGGTLEDLYNIIMEQPHE